MTRLHYTLGPETRTLSVPRDAWAMVDHVRGKFYPEIVPDMREPVFLAAKRILSDASKAGK